MQVVLAILYIIHHVYRNKEGTNNRLRHIHNVQNLEISNFTMVIQTLYFCHSSQSCTLHFVAMSSTHFSQIQNTNTSLTEEASVMM